MFEILEYLLCLATWLKGVLFVKIKFDVLHFRECARHNLSLTSFLLK